jgi:hypothetical protein
MDPVFGDLHFEAEMRAARTKGNLVAWRQRYVRERLGEAGVTQMAARLPEAARDYLLKPPSAFSWNPLGPLMDLDRAIAQGLMGGDVSQMRAFAAHIAEGDLSGIYKLFVRLAVSFRTFVGKLPGIYDTYFGPGRLVVESLEPKDARIRLDGAVMPYYLCAYGFLGWFDAAAQLTGVKDSTLTHTMCRHRGDDACRWTLQWS